MVLLVWTRLPAPQRKPTAGRTHAASDQALPPVRLSSINRVLTTSGLTEWCGKVFFQRLETMGVVLDCKYPLRPRLKPCGVSDHKSEPNELVVEKVSECQFCQRPLPVALELKVAGSEIPRIRLIWGLIWLEFQKFEV